MRTLKSLSIVLTLAVAFLTPPAAHAQTSQGPEVAVSYAAVAAPYVGLMPAGWLVSVAGPQKGSVSPVLEFGGSYTASEHEKLAFHTLQAGVRFASASNHRVKPFTQVLAGGFIATDYDSQTAFMMEFGGGVDIPIGRRVSTRLAAAVPVAIIRGERYSGLRFQVGFVFGRNH